MKNKFLFVFVLVICIIFTIPVFSSASGLEYYVSNYYQGDISVSFDSLMEQDYYIEVEFTMPYVDDTVYVGIGIFGSLDRISYYDNEQNSLTVYINGAWKDFAYRVLDLGDGSYINDSQYVAFTSVYHYIPPTLENCSCTINYVNSSSIQYPFINSIMALDGTATFSNIQGSQPYIFGAVFVRDGSFELWPDLTIQGDSINVPFTLSMIFQFGEEIYPTLENSPDRFSAYGFFVLNGNVNSNQSNPQPPSPDTPSIPDGYFDNFFMNLLQAPFEALDSLIIYETSNGFEITLFGVCSAVMGFSILIWLLKIVAGG